MHDRDFTGIAREFPAGYNHSFAVRTQRDLFRALPPKLQAETLERVQDLIARYPSGYWREIYQ